MADAAGRVDVSFEQEPAFARIATPWQSLQPRATHSFFLSWTWISSWLEASARSPDLLVACRDGTPIGLALLCRKAGSWRDLHAPSLHLTTAGGGEDDSPFIEYNGFLAERGAEDVILRGMVAELARAPRFAGGWFELALPGLDGRMRRHFSDSGLVLKDQVVRPSPFVDLDAVRRAPGGQFLGTRSRNFRAQIRRSLRLYGEDGEVRLEPARDLDDARLAFEELKDRHQRRWTARGQPGAFASPFFERFHRILMAAAWPSGNVELLRLRAGQTTVGWLYNFICDGFVYAYQCGFDYDRDARHKPGLISHACAVQRYVDADCGGTFCSRARADTRPASRQERIRSTGRWRDAPAVWMRR